jgi:glycerol-3-phosphate dehydrogenase (NAD(P)+)
MRVTVLGAGSREATVTALLCRRDHEVLLWARNPEVAGEVDERAPTRPP